MKSIKLVIMLAALSLTACGNDKPAAGSKDKPAVGSSDKPAAGSSDKPATGSNDQLAGDLCTRGVTHVMDLMAARSKGHSGPGADEQRVIDTVKQTSIEQCQKEGFTQAQLDCVLAATDWEKFEQLGECAAIKDKQPIWLRIP